MQIVRSPALTHTVLALALLAAAAPTADKLANAPAKDTKLAKLFESESHMKLGAHALTVDGEKIDADESLGDVKYDDQSKMRVVDEILAFEDGEPRKIARSFETLSDEQKNTGDDAETTKSDLEGKVVVFEWNAKDEEWKKSFRDKGDEALLEGLVRDMDFAALLPEKPVSEGDVWKIDAAKFDCVWHPGGDVGLEPDQKEQNAQIAKSAKGKLEATHKGTETVDGRKLVVIALVAELSGEADTTEDESKTHTRIEVSFEGRLRWDVEGKHVHDFEMSGNEKVSMSIHESIDDDAGEHHEVRQELEFEGPAKISMKLDAD